MLKITREQQNSLIKHIKSIDSKSTDYYQMGINARIVYGNSLDGATTFIEENVDTTSENLDKFWRGYWNGIEYLLNQEGLL